MLILVLGHVPVRGAIVSASLPRPSSTRLGAPRPPLTLASWVRQPLVRPVLPGNGRGLLRGRSWGLGSCCSAHAQGGGAVAHSLWEFAGSQRRVLDFATAPLPHSWADKEGPCPPQTFCSDAEKSPVHAPGTRAWPRGPRRGWAREGQRPGKGRRNSGKPGHPRAVPPPRAPGPRPRSASAWECGRESPVRHHLLPGVWTRGGGGTHTSLGESTLCPPASPLRRPHPPKPSPCAVRAVLEERGVGAQWGGRRAHRASPGPGPERSAACRSSLHPCLTLRQERSTNPFYRWNSEG